MGFGLGVAVTYRADLSFVEREEVALGRAAGESVRSIAARLGRSPSTVSRELRRNVDGHSSYRATTAHALAYGRASRPKPAKLATNLVLRAKVEKDLERKCQGADFSDPEGNTFELQQMSWRKGATYEELADSARVGCGMNVPAVDFNR